MRAHTFLRLVLVCTYTDCNEIVFGNQLVSYELKSKISLRFEHFLGKNSTFCNLVLIEAWDGCFSDFVKFILFWSSTAIWSLSWSFF